MSLLESRSDINLLKVRGDASAKTSPTKPDAEASHGPRSLFGFNVIRPLGEGAGSVVYEVLDPRSGRRYALKHVVVRQARDLRFIEQLEREHEVGQAVRHPSLRHPLAIHLRKTLLRRVKEAGLVMELVEGAHIPVPVRPVLQAIGHLVQVSGALEAFHKAGYVHCDLKPLNLLVDKAGRVKLIDLGQACPIGTVKERVQGTPDYISPEQVKLRAVTAKTDVYNLGATAYCILTGQKIPTLFTLKKGDNSFLMDGRITPPHEVCPDVPELLSNLVTHCICLRPEQRPEMAEVTRRLAAIQYTLKGSAQRGGAASGATG